MLKKPCVDYMDFKNEANRPINGRMAMISKVVSKIALKRSLSSNEYNSKYPNLSKEFGKNAKDNLQDKTFYNYQNHYISISPPKGTLPK